MEQKKSYYLGTVYRIYMKGDLSQAYVGSTFMSLKNRWRKHLEAVSDPKYVRPLYDMMRLHGADKFNIESLGEYGCEDRAELRSWEQAYIDFLEPPFNERRAVKLPRSHPRIRKQRAEGSRRYRLKKKLRLQTS